VRVVRAHTFLAVDRRQAVARSPLPALTTERQDTSSSAMKAGFAGASTPPNELLFMCATDHTLVLCRASISRCQHWPTGCLGAGNSRPTLSEIRHFRSTRSIMRRSDTRDPIQESASLHHSVEALAMHRVLSR
jgi:hypothetical protein